MITDDIYIYNIYIYCMYIEPMEDTNTYIHRYTYIPHQSLLDPRHCSIHPYIYVYISCIYLFYLFIYLFIIYITCAKNIHLHIISMYFYGRIKSQKPISQWPLLPGRYFTWAWGLYRTYLDGWIYVYICILCGPSQHPTPHPRPHGHGSVCTLYVESLCKI